MGDDITEFTKIENFRKNYSAVDFDSNETNSRAIFDCQKYAFDLVSNDNQEQSKHVVGNIPLDISDENCKQIMHSIISLSDKIVTMDTIVSGCVVIVDAKEKQK